LKADPVKGTLLLSIRENFHFHEALFMLTMPIEESDSSPKSRPNLTQRHTTFKDAISLETSSVSNEPEIAFEIMKLCGNML
jgi:hypothetical protein